MDKHLMSGNEAIAQGAWEAGVAVGVGYPGTPSTETLEPSCARTTSTASGPPTRRSPSRWPWAPPLPACARSSR